MLRIVTTCKACENAQFDMFLYIREQKKRATMANVNLSQLNKPGFKASLNAKSGSRIGARSLTSARNTSLFSNVRVMGQWGTINTNKANYQNVRYSLNAGKGELPRTSGYYAAASNVASNINIQNGSNAYTAGQVVGAGLSMAVGILNQTGVLDKWFGNNNKVETAGSALSNGINSLGNVSAKQGTFQGQISDANSFVDLNNVETSINNKKAALNDDYSKIGTDVINDIDQTLAGEDVKAGLEQANVAINTNELTLSQLNPNNLEECITTIDSDIEKVGTFKNSLPTSKSAISEKLGQKKQNIAADKGKLSQLESQLATADAGSKAEIQGQIDKLKQEIQKLETEQKQLEAAEKAIDEISEKCDNLESDLKAKKSEINDMKKAEDKMKDKKYDLAKSQDEKLKKSMDKLSKLNAEIKSLSGKTDDKSAEKLNKLIAERGELISDMGGLITSLTAAGTSPIANSKGQTYSIQNLGSAMNMLQSVSSDTNTASPSNGGQTVNSQGSSPADVAKPQGSSSKKIWDTEVNDDGSQEFVSLGYRDETLRNMSLDELNSLYTQYSGINDSKNMERVQKFIDLKNETS